VRLTGQNEAYYSDYLGTAEELLAAARHGFLYQGQYSQWQEGPRGTPTDGLPAWAFVSFLENHDQVANSATGCRLHALTSPKRYRAITTLWLLMPATPLLFQGQEFASSSEFQFFADVPPDYRKAVAEGRASFLSQFPSIDTPAARARLRDPSVRETFERCKLKLSERAENKQIYRLHEDLLRLRREDPVFRQQRRDRLDGATLGPDCLLLRYAGGDAGERLLIANFGRDLQFSPGPQPLLAPPCGQSWRLLFSSEEAAYGGSGARPWDETACLMPGETAIVLSASPAAACGRGPSPLPPP
jgi:maltooligosyltrehalose trehalohydrolase